MTKQEHRLADVVLDRADQMPGDVCSHGHPARRAHLYRARLLVSAVLAGER
jgi:hypothetical protein